MPSSGFAVLAKSQTDRSLSRKGATGTTSKAPLGSFRLRGVSTSTSFMIPNGDRRGSCPICRSLSEQPGTRSGWRRSEFLQRTSHRAFALNVRRRIAKGDIVASDCLHDSPDRVHNHVWLVD